MIAHDFNPSTQDAEVVKALWAQGQNELHGMFQDRQ